jgi:hypothetical protein
MAQAPVQCWRISIRAITPSALNHSLDALAGRRNGWSDLLSIVELPNWG